MIAGARKGEAKGLLGLLARALPPRLDAFVVPRLDVASAGGLDLEAAGLKAVATPRHATVLLLVGKLPEELRQAAVVVYAQMPRPRVVIALGAAELGPLPPDVVASADQEGLETAVRAARDLLRGQAWKVDAGPFEAEILLPRRRKRKKKERPEAAKEAAEPGGHGGMGHQGMDMGFMSMVRLTRHLDRSADGLPMERVQAPFGPFFPGLPSGLDLTLWLDGDTVARVEVATGAASRGIEGSLTGKAGDLPERLARIDPLAPVAYRLLATRALESTGSVNPDGKAELASIGRVELERAASHLGWLARFGYLLGYSWLEPHARQWELRLRRERDIATISSLERELLAFLSRVRRTPLLARRLQGIGRLVAPDLDASEPEKGVVGRAGLESVSGPVARASGLELDHRLLDPAYRSLPFEPVVFGQGDALARLRVRLDEIGQSVALARAAGFRAAPDTSSVARDVRAAARRGGRPSPGQSSSSDEDDRRPRVAEASVETPRGTATLRLESDGSSVTGTTLATPSTASRKLIEKVSLGLELADALVAVASLDISPWEADR